MGSSASSPELDVSLAIDAKLRADGRIAQSEFVVPLLGSPRAGRDTLGRMCRACVLSDTPLDARRHVLVFAWNAMRALADTPLVRDDAKASEVAPRCMSLIPTTEASGVANLSSFVAEMGRLWRCESVQRVAARRREENREEVEGLAALMADADRLADPHYAPTVTDLLCCEPAKKNGVSETRICHDVIPLTLVDVRAQYRQQRRWLTSFFAEAPLLVYVASLEDFVQEPGKTNRIEESLWLFEQVTNYACFCDVRVVLLLNKSDLFPAALAAHPDDFLASVPGATVEALQSPALAAECVREAFLVRRFVEPRRFGIGLNWYVIQADDVSSVRGLIRSLQDVLADHQLASMLWASGFTEDRQNNG